MAFCGSRGMNANGRFSTADVYKYGVDYLFDSAWMRKAQGMDE